MVRGERPRVEECRRRTPSEIREEEEEEEEEVDREMVGIEEEEKGRGLKMEQDEKDCGEKERKKLMDIREIEIMNE